jgi:glycosyltransferase involved in cell wall biosynthesis
MKILTITNMYPLAQDGSYGSFVRDHVEAIVRGGAEVDVFFFNPRETRTRYLTGMPGLARMLRSTRYDILHAQHSYCTVPTAGLRSALCIRTPLLFTIHEGEGHSTARAGRHGGLTKRLAYSKRLKRLALHLSDHVVTVDERLLDALDYPGPYSVIPPAVDTERYRPMDRAACRARLNLPGEEPILLFPADPDRAEKGVGTLHAALSHLDREVHVVYGGRIARSDMAAYMNAADVVVQTSYFEASPMVVKEAMACDTRVVSTDVGDVSALFGAAPGCFISEREPRALAATLRRALEWNGRVGGREMLLSHGLSPAAVAERYNELYQAMSSPGRTPIRASAARLKHGGSLDDLRVAALAKGRLAPDRRGGEGIRGG